MMKKGSIKWIISGCIIVITICFFIFWSHLREVPKSYKLDKGTLAEVNGFKIKQDYFDKRFQALPEEYKNVFKDDKEGFLEQLIAERMLIQEAEKKGFKNDLENINDKEKQKNILIGKLFSHLTDNVEVTDSQIRKFYETNKAEMNPVPYEQVKVNIKEYLTNKKKNQIIEEYLKNLQEKSNVVKNEKWLKAQQVSKTENPLNEVLNNGRPTVVDFGAKSCAPCKMMVPIFEELEKQYKGRADILIIEIYDYRDLATKYQIRAVPTQVFFDKKGIEKWRHEGFLPKEEIVKKLEELEVK